MFGDKGVLVSGRASAATRSGEAPRPLAVDGVAWKDDAHELSASAKSRYTERRTLIFVARETETSKADSMILFVDVVGRCGCN